VPTTPAQQAHYQRNKVRYISEARAQKQATVAKMRELKAASPCADCGGTFPPECMDFDHRDGEAKVADVSKLALNGTWRKVLIEVEKCDLVCANCHRIRTARRQRARNTA
jgi:hypothetical protein